MIVLKDADEEIVGEALTLAWQRIEQKGSTTMAKKGGPKRKARR
jgi:hypothetical protein